MYYNKRRDGKVSCLLCPNACVLGENETGSCGARQSQRSKLLSLNYGQITSIAMDPIEKKPLYHFYPGSQILSIGTFGCSFHCNFCQNHEISQQRPHTHSLEPADIIRTAKDNASNGIAYTYNEPFIWYEFVKETSELAHREGLKNVLVTNGYINPEPLMEILPLIDAANIDIKSISPAFYERLCKAKLRPVLNTCVAMIKANIHLEITNLIIPSENDTEEEWKDLSVWIHDNLGKSVPIHLSAYFPRYKHKASPTPPKTLKCAYRVFSELLPYTYLGNIMSAEGSATICPDCQNKLIERSGYNIKITGLDGTKCNNCGREIEVIV
ncbi:MAG: AmmeMemoRadiSam system radical SAM enzyme [Planctomycetota bacterium]